MSSFRFHNIDNGLFIAIHSKSSSSEEEWSAFIEAVKLTSPPRRRFLVVTAGGSPDAKQRAAMKVLLDDGPIPMAVVTQSLMPRMALRAISWSNPQIHAFSPDKLLDVFEFLGVDAKLAPQVKEVMASLQGELQVDVVKI